MTRALVLLGACLAVLLGGVAWITVTALRLEKAEAHARRQAAAEEAVRLALWRLDSDVAPILAREATRPYFHYLPEYPIGRPFARMFEPIVPGEAVAPSPLRRLRYQDVVGFFQIGPDGATRAPDPQRRIGVALDRDALLAALGTRTALRQGPPDGNVGLPRQQQLSTNEYAQRTKIAQQAANAANFDTAAWRAEDPGELRPLWQGGHLLLARRVNVGGELYVQGLELDWDWLRRHLAGEIRDILPAAELLPASGDAPAERRLASLPVRLEPGAPPALADEGASSIGLVLGAAWAAVLVACGTVAALLLGALALGERRAAFVSAVTHELRTPLTTLRTYTEMLEAGMVPEEKRPGYLRTLAREAERLARLVDNVLAYARLERGRRPQIEVTTGRALVERARPRLEERAAAAGVRLVLDAGGDEPVRADPAAVEQILFNLVDNACKYGGGSAVTVAARHDGRALVLAVADGGTGIAAADRRWLFAPFARSAERAAGSAPGVGLGLALCRRLARAMGGDLTLEPGAGAGATFALRLPS